MKNILLIIVLVSGLSQIGNTQDTKAIEDIKEQARMFSQYFVEGNTEALVDIYMDDAKIFPSDLDIMEGRDSLMSYWTPNPDSKWQIESHRLEPLEITITNENTAYDYGYYYGVSYKRMAPAEKNEWKGKYVVIWKKDDKGKWRMYLDIWNRVTEK
jgi:ketosteroid isomerase-like protein